MEGQVQCIKCAHNMKNKSCGGCVSQAVQSLQKIVGKNPPNESKIIPSIESYRFSCRVAMEDPGEMNNINPLQCKYFFPLALKLY